jgi:asparagine synthase (glutamine-hydrolysing)
MCSPIRSRGPDDKGTWFSEELRVGFGHRRLAIVDLSKTGRQPMVSRTGRYVITFNGEIYNYKELKSQFCVDTSPLRGGSDTGILLECIETLGLDEALKVSVGMFAFALLDRSTRKMYLVRDRMGEKPLYYGWQKDVLLFGSGLSVLRNHPKWQGGVDTQALADLIQYGYIGGIRTIHPGISKLGAGTYIEWELDRLSKEGRTTVWWSLEETFRIGQERPFVGDIHDAEHCLEELLSIVLEGQSSADVQVGALLSGGIDSSVVTGLAQKVSSTAVRTFSVSFKEKDHDESIHSRSVANKLKTIHQELIVTAEDALATIPELATAYDEPFADSSQVPSMLIYRLVSRHNKVVLSGDGGDELFGGYNRYTWGANLYQKCSVLPIQHRKTVSAILGTIPATFWGRLFQFWRVVGSDRYVVPEASEKIRKLIKIIGAESPLDCYAKLVQENVKQLVKGDHGAELPYEGQLLWNLGRSHNEKMMYTDAKTYLPDDIMVKVDRASMANSVESRAPFLDHRVVALAGSLPMEYKIDGNVGKVVLRNLYKKYLPSGGLNRPKAGFSVPIDVWLKGPLKQWASDLLNHETLSQQGFLCPRKVQELWVAHVRGRQSNHSVIWRILMFQSWLDTQ